MTSDKTPTEVRQTILNLLHGLIVPTATLIPEGAPLPVQMDQDEVSDLLDNLEQSARIVNLCDPDSVGGAGSYSVK